MFGCDSRAAASASRSSRSWRTPAWPPARTALKATARPSSRSRASQTTPKPPRPSSRTSSNRPTTAPERSTGSQAPPSPARGASAISCRSAESAPGFTPSPKPVSSRRCQERGSCPGREWQGQPAARGPGGPPNAGSSLRPWPSASPVDAGAEGAQLGAGAPRHRVEARTPSGRDLERLPRPGEVEHRDRVRRLDADEPADLVGGDGHLLALPRPELPGALEGDEAPVVVQDRLPLGGLERLPAEPGGLECASWPGTRP